MSLSPKINALKDVSTTEILLPPNQILNTNQNNMNNIEIILQDEIINIDNINLEKIKSINNNLVQLISNDKSEGALNVFKKLEKFIEIYSFDPKLNIEKKMIIIILYNIAFCYQKLKKYNLCINYLDAVLFHFDSFFETKYNFKLNENYLISNFNTDQSKNNLLGDLILEMRFSAKFHLQMSAALSQANKHIEALNHAKLAALICEDNIIKTKYLSTQMVNKIENNIKNNKENSEIIKYTIIIDELYKKVINIQKRYNINLNFNENNVRKNTENSIRNNIKNLTISNEIHEIRRKQNTNLLNNYTHSSNNLDLSEKILINNSNNNVFNSYASYRDSETKKYKSDIKLISTINKLLSKSIENNNWIKLIGIESIIYLSGSYYEDLDLDSDPKFELLPDAIFEKVILLTISYYCISNELRILSKNIQNQNTNGEFFLNLAIDLSSKFIPISCPITEVFLSSYYENYNQNLSIIPEGKTKDVRVEILRNRNFEKTNMEKIFLRLKYLKINKKIVTKFTITSNINKNVKKTHFYENSCHLFPRSNKNSENIIKKKDQKIIHISPINKSNIILNMKQNIKNNIIVINEGYSLLTDTNFLTKINKSKIKIGKIPKFKFNFTNVSNAKNLNEISNNCNNDNTKNHRSNSANNNNLHLKRKMKEKIKLIKKKIYKSINHYMNQNPGLDKLNIFINSSNCVNKKKHFSSSFFKQKENFGNSSNPKNFGNFTERFFKNKFNNNNSEQKCKKINLLKNKMIGKNKTSAINIIKKKDKNYKINKINDFEVPFNKLINKTLNENNIIKLSFHSKDKPKSNKYKKIIESIKIKDNNYGKFASFLSEQINERIKNNTQK